MKGMISKPPLSPRRRRHHIIIVITRSARIRKEQQWYDGQQVGRQAEVITLYSPTFLFAHLSTYLLTYIHNISAYLHSLAPGNHQDYAVGGLGLGRLPY